VKDIQDVLMAITDGRIREYLKTNVELKRSWGQPHGKKISFLSNKNLFVPSWLVIGIDDDGVPAGHDEAWAKQTEELVSQHLAQYLDPIQSVTAVQSRQLYSSAWILVLEIVNPGVVVRWDSKAYIGAGTTLREMTPEEIMELTVTLPGTNDCTAQPSTADYDSRMVGEFTSRVGARQTDGLFSTIASIPQAEALSRLRISDTNAARLLFGRTPYRVVHYRSDGEPSLNETRYGLFGLIQGDMISEIAMLPGVAKIRSNIPTRAVKEGIANAVAHASYHENNGEIMVELYPDRMVISNLCLPESGYFANKWFSRGHKTLNMLLMETLRVCGAVDELGRGKSLIYSESLRKGNLPPEVVIEQAGRFNRWRLFIFFQSLEQKHIMMLQRLMALYKDEHKAQIANALVLWRNKKVAEIREYIDGESFPLFSDILGDFTGPVFYYEKDDSLILRRWARLIIEKGVSSKVFTVAEEESLLRFSYDICTKYRNGILTSVEFRELANMGNSPSEVTLSSNMLRKWKNLGVIERVKKGTYRFARVPESESVEENLEILRRRLFQAK